MPRYLTREDLIEMSLEMNRRWLSDHRSSLAGMEAGEIGFWRGSQDCTREAIDRSRKAVEVLTAAIAELERQKLEGDLTEIAVRIVSE